MLNRPKRVVIQHMDPCLFLVCCYDVISNWFLYFDVKNSVTVTEILLYFCVVITKKIACYFLIFHIRPNLWSNFCYYIRLKRFQLILRISNGIESMVEATDILMMRCYLYNKSWTIPLCLILISNRANSPVVGPTSLTKRVQWNF